MPTAIEKHDEDLSKMMNNLGVSAHFRGGVYWWSIPGFEFQLTYPEDHRDGRRIKVKTLDHKCEIAMSILERVKAARKSWGGSEQRGMTILAGLKEETIPAFTMGNFCYFVDPSLDYGVASRFSLAGECTVSIRLVGGKEIEGRGKTFDAALGNLRKEGQRHDWGMLYCYRCKRWIKSKVSVKKLDPEDTANYCGKCIAKAEGRDR